MKYSFFFPRNLVLLRKGTPDTVFLHNDYHPPRVIMVILFKKQSVKLRVGTICKTNARFTNIIPHKRDSKEYL